jgi:hypothetical protein
VVGVCGGEGDGDAAKCHGGRSERWSRVLV